MHSMPLHSTPLHRRPPTSGTRRPRVPISCGGWGMGRRRRCDCACTAGRACSPPSSHSHSVGHAGHSATVRERMSVDACRRRGVAAACMLQKSLATLQRLLAHHAPALPPGMPMRDMEWPTAP